MNDLIKINRLLECKNEKLMDENKMLWKLLAMCYISWMVTESALIYLAYYR